MYIWSFVFFLNFTFTCFASINFIHINKTGGTTLRTLLKEHFDQADLYPYTKTGVLWKTMYNKNGDIWEPVAMDKILSQFPLISQKVIMGHFPIWFLQKKDPNFFSTSFIFTILRDPVERVLSHYFYMKKLKHPIDDPVKSPLDVPPNQMCLMLCSDNTLTGESLLKDALKNLEQMDYIIFQDNFERDVIYLFNKIGLDHRGTIPRLNETNRWEEFDEEMIQKIREKNDLDVQLYKYAARFLRYKNF